MITALGLRHSEKEIFRYEHRKVYMCIICVTGMCVGDGSVMDVRIKH